jgi:hypothetical protein
VANMFIGPLLDESARATATSNTLNAQRPTPVAGMFIGPLLNESDRALATSNVLNAQRPTPVASMIDNVSGPAGNATRAINSIPNRTVTVTFNEITNRIINWLPGSGGPGAAFGGAVEDLVGQRQPVYRYDSGGAVVGPGWGQMDMVRAIGPDPRARYRIGNGEHILDTRDVSLLGGQSQVYALREMLNMGKLGNAPVDTIRQMVDNGAGVRKGDSEPGTIAGFINYGRVELRDESQFYRQAEQARREILASVLG